MSIKSKADGSNDPQPKKFFTKTKMNNNNNKFKN